MNRLATGLLCALLATSCERCAPDLVAEGVARLSIRSAAVVATLVEDDEACGFSSDSAVLTVEGEPGGLGTATTSITGCTIALGSDALVATDCNGVETHASGSITVTAHKVIRGHVTGDARNPVIPQDASAVSIVLDSVTATDFAVSVDDDAAARFVIQTGGFAAQLDPQLVADVASGFCTLPTRNAAIALTYEPSAVHVDADGRSFDVDVGAADLTAAAGALPDGENALSGSITVFGAAREVAIPLDPAYDAAAFATSWTCDEPMGEVPSSECPVAEILGGGAARLTVRTLGVITQLIEQDTACGFANADTRARAAVVGTVGSDGAAVTYGIAAPCVIELPAPVVVDTDCNGTQTRAQGHVSVTGTKRVTGYATGSTETPVVPTSRDAVEFNLVADIDGFTVEVDGQPGFAIDAGLLSGRVAVRTAQEVATGACALPTPAAQFHEVALAAGSTRILTESATVHARVDVSGLVAQNGPGPLSENTLSATVALDGTTATLTDVPLDDTYDAVDFQSTYICEPGLLIPLDDSACTFRPPLGQLTARALMDAVDTAIALRRASGCTGDCLSEVYANEDVATDCTTTTRVNGSFAGALATSTSADAPAVEHVALTDLNFTAFSADRGGDAHVTFTGAVAGAVDVVFAEHGNGAGGGTGVFDVSTPTRRYEEISVSGNATVVIDGMTFNFTLGGSALNGVRGAFGGDENVLTGTIVVDDQEVTIPVDRRDARLEQDYDAAAFVERYTCEEGYFVPVPAE